MATPEGKVRWGILATGGIARQFAEGLAVCESGTLAAVASRTRARAEEFAAKHGAGKAYEGRDALLADLEIDAIYIATPHHTHLEDTIAAAQAGKAILCEKPFVLTAEEAERGLKAVKAAGVPFMEAFMYRCSPGIAKVRELLDSGAIGEPMQVNAEFGFQAGRDWDNFRTEAKHGGGGLMDVGGYCVSMARLVFGSEPIAAHYAKGMDEEGYDGVGAGLLVYEGGKTAHFGTGIHLQLRNDVRIYGTEGRIRLNEPWKWGEGATVVLRKNGQDSEIFDCAITNAELYAHEADAFARAMAGNGEAPEWTHEDTLVQARTLDKLKASAGMTFSSEA